MRSITSRSVSEVVEALEADGAVIVEGLLDDADIDAINAELDPWVEATSTVRPFMSDTVAWFYGAHTRHVTALPARSSTFTERVLCSPTILGVCDAVLGPSCATYQLNLAHLFDRGPGAKRQYLHRDEIVWAHLPRPHDEVEVSMVIALVDFTADNGATVVAPGSHRWPLDRQPTEDELEVAAMPAGSAILYLGSTIHGGGANITPDMWRRGIHLSYVVGWLRPEENHVLAAPPDIARHMPPVAQELLGYAVHNAEAIGGGYLGSLDLQDPVELLRAGAL
jgi:ectoine hydroxylase-related dioxygenase (phytanoyl-CoA dioxygenase family)